MYALCAMTITLSVLETWHARGRSMKRHTIVIHVEWNLRLLGRMKYRPTHDSAADIKRKIAIYMKHLNKKQK